MSASSWASSQEQDKEQQFCLWVDRAQVNIGCELEKEVEGRISTEVDGRLANDKDALVSRAKGIMAMYNDAGVAGDRVLMRLPATWAGIAAAGELESSGVQCHCTSVYSYAQAVLAVRAGVSVISVNLRAMQDEYKLMPGLIKDPTGPREDSGVGSGVDPAIRLVRDIYQMMKQEGAATKLLITGVRTAEDALNMAGSDYLVLPDTIIRQLSSKPTLEGYNTGLSTEALSEEPEPELLSAKGLGSKSASSVDGAEAAFKTEIGVAGDDLLKKSLARLAADVERARSYFEDVAAGQE